MNISLFNWLCGIVSEQRAGALGGGGNEVCV
jgi:hypothetical protein